MKITQLKDLFNLTLSIDDVAVFRDSNVTESVCKVLYLYEAQLVETALSNPDKGEMIKQMRVELSNIRKQFEGINAKFNGFSDGTGQNPINEYGEYR